MSRDSILQWQRGDAEKRLSDGQPVQVRDVIGEPEVAGEEEMQTSCMADADQEECPCDTEKHLQVRHDPD